MNTLKNIITFFAFYLLTVASINAKRQIDSLIYENTQDIIFLKK
jgi:hypothetical protein